MKEAAEELIEIREVAKEEVATLKENVRKIAAPLIGRPPVAAALQAPVIEPPEAKEADEPLDDNIDGEMDLRDDEPEEECVDDGDGNDDEADSASLPTEREHPPSMPKAESDPTDDGRLIPQGSPEAAGKPVRRSIKEVQTGFSEWVKDLGESVKSLSSEKLKELSPRLRTFPEYILHVGKSPALVIIRPTLSKTQRHDLQEWQRVFGTHHEVLRIWPVKQKLRWVWTAETVFAATERDANRVDSSGVSDEVTADEPRGPAPHKSTDFSHVSHRLDNLQEEMDGLDEMLRQAGEIQRRLRSEIEAIRDQLRRVTHSE
jgi:hypothetical protein